MFGLISFILKILFAVFFGALINYSFDQTKNNNEKIILSAMFSLFSCSLLAMSLQFPNDIRGIISGASIIAVIGTILVVTKNQKLESRIIYLFASLIGLIIASGLIFQAIVFSIIIVLLKKYSNPILESLIIEEEE